MAGSEYMPSIKGVGLKVAIKYFKKHGTLENVIKELKKNKTFENKIPEDYLERFMQVQ